MKFFTSGPLLLVTGVIAGWIALRLLWIFWPWTGAATSPIAAPAPQRLPGLAQMTCIPTTSMPQLPAPPPLGRTTGLAVVSVTPALSRAPNEKITALTILPAPQALPVMSRPETYDTFPEMPLPPPTRRPTWALAAWALYRPQVAHSIAPFGQYGGSQLGIRLAYPLHTRLDIFARITATPPPQVTGEAAAGLAIRPVRTFPVQLAVEARQGLTRDNRASAWAAYLVGGVNEVTLGPRLQLDGYAAAGVVTRARPDIFADGWLRSGYRLSDNGPITMDVGAGIWGGAQRDAARLDIGPSVTATWDSGTLRTQLSLDYRYRLLGNAQPTSGPAITLTTGF